MLALLLRPQACSGHLHACLCEIGMTTFNIESEECINLYSGIVHCFQLFTF
jgi:hypothetical protein